MPCTVYPILDLKIERKRNIPGLKYWVCTCDFSLTVKVKCPESLKCLLRQSCLLKGQSALNAQPCQVGYWRSLLCDPGLRRDNHWFMKCHGQHCEPIKHWFLKCHRQHCEPIKSGTNPHPLQPQGLSQPRQKQDHETQDEGSVPLSTTFVCAAQEDEAQPSVPEVPGMVWSGRQPWGVGGAVCVCVYISLLVLSCGSISWVISLQRNTTSFPGPASVLFGVTYISAGCWLTVMHFSRSWNGERGSVKQLLEFLHLTSELELSQKCLDCVFSSDFFCTVLWILLCLVKTDKVCWFAQRMGKPGGMMLDETKRQGLKFLLGILLLAFRRMANFVHCFHWHREEQGERVIQGFLL